jgi:hypothetical protein
MTGSTCRSAGCGARVIFIPSAKTGKPMILDAEPKKLVVVGNHELADQGGAWWFDDPAEGTATAKVVDVYTPHHATCPAAKSWAGKSRRDPPAEAVV